MLTPFAWLYNFFGQWRQSRYKPVKVDVPVICIGNLVMGGAGKTPTVIAIVELLKKMGYIPHILSRGYGAVIKEVIHVNPDTHNYLQVGDESLLLAKVTSTWASSNRIKSAKAAIAAGATILVMDDGLQNHSLHKDFTILVIDALQGFGNQKIFPAGPLRESIKNGLKKADAVMVIGDDNQQVVLQPHQVKFTAKICSVGCIQPKPVLAFAGLGYPEKFRLTLENNGYLIKSFVVFADHHPYTVTDVQKLIKMADGLNVPLITTAKDYIRIPYSYRHQIEFLPINLEFDSPSQVQYVLKQHLNYKI